MTIEKAMAMTLSKAFIEKLCLGSWPPIPNCRTYLNYKVKPCCVVL